MQFTADQVWALAVAADRINGSYLKEDQWEEQNGSMVKTKEANKLMVKRWLREGTFPVTEQDTEEGRRVRQYFNTFIMRELAGKLNDFERQALKLAQKEEFTGRDLYDFAVISCLPSVARRDLQRQEIKREIYNSDQLQGKVGETVVGDFTVINCWFNQNYCKWRVQGRMGEAFVDFWFSKELVGELKIKGKIKAVRGDKTTQLNYVKIIG
jgi:hypothetical protein